MRPLLLLHHVVGSLGGSQTQKTGSDLCHISRGHRYHLLGRCQSQAHHLAFTHVILFSPHHTHDTRLLPAFLPSGPVYGNTPILQMRKLRLGQVEKSAQVPAAQFRLKSIQLLCLRQCLMTTPHTSPSDHGLS